MDNLPNANVDLFLRYKVVYFACVYWYKHEQKVYLINDDECMMANNLVTLNKKLILCFIFI